MISSVAIGFQVGAIDGTAVPMKKPVRSYWRQPLEAILTLIGVTKVMLLRFYRVWLTTG
jgi:hypothetical protein